ncbi:hypothetical protein D1872_267270 [compost metagenome]
MSGIIGFELRRLGLDAGIHLPDHSVLQMIAVYISGGPSRSNEQNPDQDNPFRGRLAGFPAAVWSGRELRVVRHVITSVFLFPDYILSWGFYYRKNR